MTEQFDKKVTVTIKGENHTDPWLVVNASSPVELHSMLEALASNGIGAVVANAQTAFRGHLAAGKGLGATPIEAPQNPEPPAQQENPWAASVPPQQQAAPAQQDPWGGYGQQAQAPAQQAQPQQAGNFGGDDAPFLSGIGMQAKVITGVSKKTNKPWRAAADPRPQNMTQGITERTDDPNHPGLAAGTHTFWKFLRD